MNREEIYSFLKKIESDMQGMGIEELDSRLSEFALDNIDILVSENDIFFAVNELSSTLKWIRGDRCSASDRALNERGAFSERLTVGNACCCYDGYYDFGHIAPDFSAILSLGLPGLRDRARAYSEKNGDPASKSFFESVDRAYGAAERFLIRASETAAFAGSAELSRCLSALSARAPESLYEAMELIFVFYGLIHEADATDVRTLGRLDALLQPYYEADIASGRLDKVGVRRLALHFMDMLEGFKINANLPFAIGGEVNGKNSACEMSYVLLEAYTQRNHPHVKIHFLYNENTPRELVKMAFDGIRRGANSIVFLCDRTVKSSLLHVGASPEDVENYSVVGCYECGARDEVTCSCAGKFNIVKAIEAAIFGGIDPISGKLVGIETEIKDFESFDEFFEAFSAQLTCFARSAMEIVDIYESEYPKLHSSLFFSSTYLSCLERGGDVYSASGAKYCNSSLNALGLGTATDSLVAIKKLVYDDKLMSLSELGELLLSDWEGQEELRLTVKNKYPKYGMGDAEADSVARRIVEVIDRVVSGKPNAKGGVYRFGLFSIDWRVPYGKKALASADGRKRGEMLSLNTGAALGSDKNGITSHLLSVTKAGGELTPNGSVLDLDMHKTAVGGDDGLDAMVATLETYEKMGGFAVHYNVLDRDILIDAKENPHKYPNLQVRLCGWNALFTQITPELQDDFIKRTESGG